MSIAASDRPDRLVFTPSELNSNVREALETGFPNLWVEGEISNLARPASGHLYFSLKDSAAQIRCAMFRGRNQLLRFQPANGMQVLVRGKITVYEARGEYQLLVDHMEEAGHGALQREFEALKARLQAEGLFDPARKKALPTQPRAIGIITSPTGAAIRDMITTIRRRYPLVHVIVYPAAVQGKESVAELRDALAIAAARREVDVLIFARGGGSLEDMIAFNDEALARAIAACPIPTVSGVGHEIDFTIADFVADQRAPTPTAAAELVTPDQADYRRQLHRLAERLAQTGRARLLQQQQKLSWLEKRLQQQHPGQRLRQRAQRLDELDTRLAATMTRRMAQHRQQLALARSRLRESSPLQTVHRLRERFAERQRQLLVAEYHYRREREQALAALSRSLHAISPLATLGRGYSILMNKQSEIIRSVRNVTPDDIMTTRLIDGNVTSRVTDIKEKK